MKMIINLEPLLMFSLTIIPFILNKRINKREEENSEMLKVRRSLEL